MVIILPNPRLQLFIRHEMKQHHINRNETTNVLKNSKDRERSIYVFCFYVLERKQNFQILTSCVGTL